MLKEIRHRVHTRAYLKAKHFDSLSPELTVLTAQPLPAGFTHTCEGGLAVHTAL